MAKKPANPDKRKDKKSQEIADQRLGRVPGGVSTGHPDLMAAKAPKDPAPGLPTGQRKEGQRGGELF